MIHCKLLHDLCVRLFFLKYRFNATIPLAFYIYLREAVLSKCFVSILSSTHKYKFSCFHTLRYSSKVWQQISNLKKAVWWLDSPLHLYSPQHSLWMTFKFCAACVWHLLKRKQFLVSTQLKHCIKVSLHYWNTVTVLHGTLCQHTDTYIYIWLSLWPSQSDSIMPCGIF